MISGGFSLFSLNIIACVAGFLLDIFFGDPDFRLHPVRLTGDVVLFYEKRIYPKNAGFFGGLLLSVAVVGTVTGAVLFVLWGAYQLSPVLFVVADAAFVWFAVSVRSMGEHALRVTAPLLSGDCSSAKDALAGIVSRDTADMTEAKIVSSAIESVSENSVDGMFTPYLFAVAGGGAAAFFFKAVSTLDSMVGYKNERYIRFGTASARLDDFLNFVPARISIIPVLAGCVVTGGSLRGALRAFIHDRKKHDSPNSAHPMSAFAGALGVRLGGATSYFGRVKEKPYLNATGAECRAQDVSRAVSLYTASAYAWVLIITGGAVWGFIRFFSV